MPEERHERRATMHMQEMTAISMEYDYVIVGAGSAGCLLANRLSADPASQVLLLEAGGPDDYPWIHIPVGYLYCIGNPRTDWMFQTEPDPGLNGRTLRYPRGKALGGCSSINGMIYMRGQARDYDHWASATGDDAWSWAQCLPDFKAHEDHWRLDEDAHFPDAAARAAFAALHGSGGEWRVEKQRLRWDILDAFAAAAQQAGIPATDDFNRGENEGVMYFDVNQRRGWRWNTAKAFLRPHCIKRPNLTVWTHAQAQRLLFNDGGDALACTGVSVLRKGKGQFGGASVQVRARREVILCAGSIATPQLLQCSGIGPGAWLHQHQIPVRLDRPGVGANLQDHLQIRSVYQVSKVQTLNTLAASLWGKARIGLQYLWSRSGPMSMAPSQLGVFTRSDVGQRWANIQYHVQPLSLDAFGEPLHRFNAFTASVCNLNPTSRGTVRIRSPRVEDAPAIAPNYLSTRQDRQVAVDSLRVTRRIVAQPALAPYAPQEIKPGVQYQSDEDLIRLAGDIATTIFHPAGTTRMGRADDSMAVVDSRLRVLGVRALRVVDAGVMPTIPSGNINSPTLMIAQKAARWIAGKA